jgi:hypothetical protein
MQTIFAGALTVTDINIERLGIGKPELKYGIEACCLIGIKFLRQLVDNAFKREWLGHV